MHYLIRFLIGFVLRRRRQPAMSPERAAYKPEASTKAPQFVGGPLDGKFAFRGGAVTGGYSKRTVEYFGDRALMYVWCEVTGNWYFERYVLPSEDERTLAELCYGAIDGHGKGEPRAAV